MALFWGTISAVCGGVAFGLMIAGLGGAIGGVFLVVAVVAALAFLYLRMSPLQRLNYRFNVMSSFRGRGGRCRECGNATPSEFCSEDCEVRNTATTAW